MLSASMGLADFTASNGWLESWQKRFSVRLATLCGEAADVPEYVVADWAKRLPSITAGYAMADIYNADETGLYFRALPNRSMVLHDDHRKGIKTSKERITVLLGCSAAGDKLKPLVIGKAENPRCFHGTDKASLPVTYRANRKAWMTTILFQEWLERLNSAMKLQRREILMFVDNCSAHPATELSNIKLVFLPPNTTSRLQPCDAGIIANVKSLHRKRLLRHVLAQMDEAESATELAKRVNVLDAISWLHSAWAGVTEDCVRKCFAKCGFHPVGDALPVEQESGPDDNRPDEHESAPDDNTLVLLGDVEWNDFVGMDDAIHTTAIHDDDWEAALVAKANGDVPDDEDCGDEEEGADEEEPPARPTLSARDAMSSVKDLLDFARVANDAAMIEAATSLENIVEIHCVKQAASARQTTMLEFFQR